MTFQENETGISTGQPIELYEFRGTYNNYFYTSYARDISSFGQLYRAIPISRDRLKIGNQEDDNLSLEISLPFDNPMVEEYAYGNAPPKLDFELKRVHLQQLDLPITSFRGLVQAFSVEGRIAKLAVPSIFSYILKGTVPIPRYQGPCNHVLYDTRCGVPTFGNVHTTTVNSISGNQIIVASLPFADNDCAAGVIRNSDGEARMVLSHTGPILNTTYPFAGLEVGDTVTVSRGCDHSLTTCRVKFANEIRFGGFPLVPAKNPFTNNIRT